MEGTIVNFRKGRHTIYHNQMIVIISGISSKEKAESLKEKRAVWKSKAGNEITGEVMASHGNKGAVRIRFEKGMPGQSIGTKVEVK